MNLIKLIFNQFKPYAILAIITAVLSLTYFGYKEFYSGIEAKVENTHLVQTIKNNEKVVETKKEVDVIQTKAVAKSIDIIKTSSVKHDKIKQKIDVIPKTKELSKESVEVLVAMSEQYDNSIDELADL